jgi:two-component system, response regulator PdtaR
MVRRAANTFAALERDAALNVLNRTEVIPLSASEVSMGRAVPGARPAILVVEDEPVTRLSAMDMVEAAGCEAIGAADADEAIRVLEARSDIRAVFTDIYMPGSIDGLGLMRLMQERWPAVTALLTSGTANPASLPRGVRFVAKPYLPPQIEAALRQLIG